MTIAKELSEGKLGIGDYLWWSSGNMGASWNCPYIILDIQNESFRVKSYDTYEVSSWIPFGNDDVLSEFRICNKEEVKITLMLGLKLFAKLLHYSINKKNN